jgi:predicted nucleotidyltransferase
VISSSNKKKFRVKDVPPAVADYVAQLRDLLGADLRDVVLFGSRATGTHGPNSDYDLAVFVGDDADLARSRRIASDAAYPLVLRGYDIRPVVLHFHRREERSQFLGHVRDVGIRL